MASPDTPLVVRNGGNDDHLERTEPDYDAFDPSDEVDVDALNVSGARLHIFGNPHDRDREERFAPLHPSVLKTPRVRQQNTRSRRPANLLAAATSNARSSLFQAEERDDVAQDSEEDPQPSRPSTPMNFFLSEDGALLNHTKPTSIGRC
jgi:hypothetical protein